MLALAVSACAGDAEWVPADLPAKVWISRDLPSEQVPGTVRAIGWWQREVPGVIVEYVGGEPGHDDCGIRIVSAEPAKDTALADTASADGCVTTIRVKPSVADADVVRVVTHELGHAFLGPDHSPDVHNLMFHRGADSPTLTVDQLTAVLARM